MPSITPSGSSAINFTFLRGLVEGEKTSLEQVTRPGVGGVAVRDLGSRGEIFEMTGIVDCDTLAAAKTTLESIEALQGTVGNTVVDDYASSNADVIIIHVRPLEKKKLIGASGGISTTKGALVIVQFTMQRA